jgi:hypothetical protein
MSDAFPARVEMLLAHKIRVACFGAWWQNLASVVLLFKI